MTPTGFPHSEIPGSTPACGSPRLIAASHVLHRLLTPRHPPCALTSLTAKTFAAFGKERLFPLRIHYEINVGDARSRDTLIIYKSLVESEAPRRRP
jgi:hypothetical protein